MRANDLAFSLHCNLMSTLMLLQLVLYKGEEGQRITALCWSGTAGDYDDSTWKGHEKAKLRHHATVAGR